ncbi:MAG TPA: hypothetical protein PLP30_00025 [Clostridia bacterium]|nr:hypothetical protein [Clostridia bacterium]HRX42480.1 hypothetical protein [Clostridia bacterium]
MLTKGNWLIVSIRVKGFRLWLPLPLFILAELLWQLMELMEFIGFFGVNKVKEFREAMKAMPLVVEAVSCIGAGERYDLVDVDVEEENGDKVRVLIRVW